MGHLCTGSCLRWEPQLATVNLRCLQGMIYGFGWYKTEERLQMALCPCRCETWGYRGPMYSLYCTIHIRDSSIHRVHLLEPSPHGYWVQL